MSKKKINLTITMDRDHWKELRADFPDRSSFEVAVDVFMLGLNSVSSIHKRKKIGFGVGNE